MNLSESSSMSTNSGLLGARHKSANSLQGQQAVPPESPERPALRVAERM
jgi:hypothetical protein